MARTIELVQQYDPTATYDPQRAFHRAERSVERRLNSTTRAGKRRRREPSIGKPNRIAEMDRNSVRFLLTKPSSSEKTRDVELQSTGIVFHSPEFRPFSVLSFHARSKLNHFSSVDSSYMNETESTQVTWFCTTT